MIWQVCSLSQYKIRDIETLQPHSERNRAECLDHYDGQAALLPALDLRL